MLCQQPKRSVSSIEHEKLQVRFLILILDIANFRMGLEPQFIDISFLKINLSLRQDNKEMCYELQLLSKLCQKPTRSLKVSVTPDKSFKRKNLQLCQMSYKSTLLLNQACQSLQNAKLQYCKIFAKSLKTDMGQQGECVFNEQIH